MVYRKEGFFGWGPFNARPAWTRKPSGRRLFCPPVLLSPSLQPATGMRRQLRLAQGQNPGSQHPSQFSVRVQGISKGLHYNGSFSKFASGSHFWRELPTGLECHKNVLLDLADANRAQSQIPHRALVMAFPGHDLLPAGSPPNPNNGVPCRF